MKQKHIIIILSCVIALFSVFAVFQIIQMNTPNNTIDSPPSTEQEGNLPGPIDPYTAILDWLLKNGKRSQDGTSIQYTTRYQYNKTIEISYSTSFEDTIYFYMSFPNHKGNSLTLTYNIEKDNSSDSVMYWVELESNNNSAYSENNYSLTKSTFVKNSLIKSGSFVSSYNTSRFPTPYTEEEKNEGYQLYKEVNKIHYDCLLTFLDWLKSNFTKTVGISMADLGYLKY